MTGAADPQAFAAAVVARLTGPGGRFEQAVEPVLGVPMPVMRHRRRSLGEVLEESRAYADRDYLVTVDRRLSYAEHYAAATALARALAERHGVGKGDRVGILAANTPEWVVAFWAIQRLGAIAVGYNAWWAPPEIEYGLGHTEPTVLIADARRAALVGTGEVPVLTMETDLPRLISEYADADPVAPAAVAEDDPAVILYTSGTSGRPKGVVHSHRNLLAVIDYHRFGDALQAAFAGLPDAERPSDARYLLTSPLFHIASLHNLVVPRLATGSAVVLYQGGFDVHRVLELIAGERVTSWGAVPTMAARLLDADLSRYDLSALRNFALASAPSSVELQQRLRERVPFARNAMVDSYGLTESATAVAVATPPELVAFPGTVGRPIIGVAVRIADAAGAPVPDGDEGEIWVRGPYVMLGYWRDDPATAAAVDAERWLRTGDVGTLVDGRLRLSGRRSDLILRGGENIYPTEVEQCLEAHPDVLECAVVGIPHPDLGSEPAAVVVVAPGARLGAAELRAFAAARLAYFKVPAVWRFTSEALPRNATGKVIRPAVAVSDKEHE